MVRQSVNNVENINKLPIVMVLITGAFLAILNQTLLTTAIPPIMQDLNLTESTAQGVTTIFMLVNGIMIPITAFLIETFTTRQLFITAMGTFSVGTLICAISPSFFLLMAGRVIQAAGAGVMMPLMMTILFVYFSNRKKRYCYGDGWARDRICSSFRTINLGLVIRALRVEVYFLYRATISYHKCHCCLFCYEKYNETNLSKSR